jgi:hypothetical protein
MMRRIGCSTFLLTSVLVVAGCSSEPDLAADRAHTLQLAVLDVTEATAAGRWADAQVLLEKTRTELDEGADGGEVSTARYRQIDTALDEVQSQLAAELERAAAAEQEAAAAAAAAAQAAAEQAAADQAAQAAAATPEPVVVDRPPPAPKGPGKHPGKGKGGG